MQKSRTPLMNRENLSSYEKENNVELRKRSDRGASSNNSNKMKILLAEKEKEIALLEQQLRQYRLQADVLSEIKSRSLDTNDCLQVFNTNRAQENKIRRSKLLRKELEIELEQLEDRNETLASRLQQEIDRAAELSSNLAARNEELKTIEANLKRQFEHRLGQQADEYSRNMSSLSSVVSDFEVQVSSLITENRAAATNIQEREVTLSSLMAMLEEENAARKSLEIEVGRLQGLPMMTKNVRSFGTMCDGEDILVGPMDEGRRMLSINEEIVFLRDDLYIETLVASSLSDQLRIEKQQSEATRLELTRLQHLHGCLLDQQKALDMTVSESAAKADLAQESAAVLKTQVVSQEELIHALQSQLMEAQQKTAALECSLREAHSSAESRCASVETALLSQLQGREQDLMQQLEVSENLVEVSAETAKRLQETILEKEKEIMRMSEEKLRAVLSSAFLQKRILLLGEDLLSSEDKRAALTDALKDLREVLERKSEIVVSMSHRYAMLDQDYVQQKERADKRDAETLELQSAIRTKDESLREAREEVARLLVELSGVRDLKAVHDQQLSEHARTWESMVRAIEVKYSTAVQDVTTLNDLHCSAVQTITKMETSIADSADKNASLQSSLEQKNLDMLLLRNEVDDMKVTHENTLRDQALYYETRLQASEVDAQQKLSEARAAAAEKVAILEASVNAARVEELALRSALEDKQAVINQLKIGVERMVSVEREARAMHAESVRRLSEERDAVVQSLKADVTAAEDTIRILQESQASIAAKIVDLEASAELSGAEVVGLRSSLQEKDVVISALYEDIDRYIATECDIRDMYESKLRDQALCFEKVQCLETRLQASEVDAQQKLSEARAAAAEKGAILEASVNAARVEELALRSALGEKEGIILALGVEISQLAMASEERCAAKQREKEEYVARAQVLEANLRAAHDEVRILREKIEADVLAIEALETSFSVSMEESNAKRDAEAVLRAQLAEARSISLGNKALYQKELEQANNTAAALQLQVNTLEHRCAVLANESEEHVSAHRESLAAVSALRSEVATQATELGSLKTENYHIQQRLINEINRFAAEKEDMCGAALLSDETVKRMGRQLTAAEACSTSLSSKLVELQGKLEAADESRARLEAQLFVKNDEAAALERALRIAEETLESLRGDMESVRKEKDSINACQNGYIAAEERLQQELTAKTAEVIDLQHRLETVTKTEEKLFSLPEDGSAIITVNREELVSLQENLKKYKKEVDRVKEENAHLSGHANTKQKIHYVNALKQQMSALVEENERLRGIRKNVNRAITATISKV